MITVKSWHAFRSVVIGAYIYHRYMKYIRGQSLVLLMGFINDKRLKVVIVWPHFVAWWDVVKDGYGYFQPMHCSVWEHMVQCEYHPYSLAVTCTYGYILIYVIFCSQCLNKLCAICDNIHYGIVLTSLPISRMDAHYSILSSVFQPKVQCCISGQLWVWDEAL